MGRDVAETKIHSTAIVDSNAEIGEGSSIGPYCIIGPDVRIGKNCHLESHVVIRGHTLLSEGVRVYPFAMLGGEPQHLGYKEEPTTVEIGERVTIRESVTIHRGTTFGHGRTVVGSDSYIMAYCHLAHDCTVGRNVILANSVQLAGHCVVEDFATLGGLSGTSQYCRVGRYCYVGGGSILRKDLPPFLSGKGNEFRAQGINVIGLTRRGFSQPTLTRLKKLFKIFYLQHLTISQALEKVSVELGESDEVRLFTDFIQSSKVGFIR